MTTFTERPVTRTLARLIDNVGRSRARRALLALSDRALIDAGFSRAALESGIAAWPWRAAAGETPVASVRAVPSLSRVVPGAPVPVPAASFAPDGHEGRRKAA